jgi:hypothetical protein
METIISSDALTASDVTRIESQEHSVEDSPEPGEPALTSADRQDKDSQDWPVDPKTGKPTKESDLLRGLCSDFIYFNAGSMRYPFIQITNEDHREVWPEEHIRHVLVSRFLDLTGQAPKRDPLNDVMDGIKARCNRGEQQEIYSRIARTPDKIYLDLCNKKWEAVEIDKDGWRVVSKPPVYFRRSNEAEELPMPVSGGSLDELRPLLNAGDDDQWILMMGWLVGVFQPTGAFSHIAIGGQEGSAKTTTSENLISIVDPNEAGLCGPPKDEQDFSIIAMSVGVLGFDNFSGCRAAMSDIFCRCSTGMAFRTRKLYTNTEVSSIKLRIPLLMNGIDTIVVRGDLLRRTIVLQLPVVHKENRKTASYLKKQYQEKRPRILGALLEAVSCGLKNLDSTVVTNPPSMADFAQWVKACEPALPWRPGAFLEAYHSMQHGASEALFEQDQFAKALFNWLWPQIQGKVLEVSSGDLLTDLNKTIRLEMGRIHPVDVRSWPKLNTIANYLNRVGPMLSRKGIQVERTRRTEKSKGLWRFEKMKRKAEGVPEAA